MIMSYIRFRLVRSTDAGGDPIQARFKRVESDMPSLSTLETNIIWNALSKVGAAMMWLALDEGVLERDMLGESDWLKLDRDMLDVDKLI